LFDMMILSWGPPLMTRKPGWSIRHAMTAGRRQWIACVSNQLMSDASLDDDEARLAGGSCWQS